MASHGYSPSQALALLLKKVEDGSPELAGRLRAAIDAGKDDWSTETRVGTGKPRKYRKAMRLSDEEALRVVVSALRAHFVEQPLLTTSAASEFAGASLGVDAASPNGLPFDQRPSPLEVGEPIETRLEIELQTETKVLPLGKEREGQETVQVSSTDLELIEDQKSNIELLSELTKFDLR